MATTLHPHCSTCVNLHCLEPAHHGTSCEVTSCSLACGAAFHSCKGSEHRLLCPLEPVPCPSQSYGCPLSMPRARVAQHLAICPASVVRCRHTHFPSIHPVSAHTLSFTADMPDKHSTDTQTASIHSTDAYTMNTNPPLTHTTYTQVSNIQTQNANLYSVNPGLNGKDSLEDTLHKRIKNIPNVVLCNNITNGVSEDLERSVAEAASTRHPITSAAAKTENHLAQSDRAETKEGGSEGRCAGQSASEGSASWEDESPLSQPLSDLDAFPPCYDREARLQLLHRFLPPELSARFADTPVNHGIGPTQNQGMEGCSAADYLGWFPAQPITKVTEIMEASLGEASCAPVPLTSTTPEMPSQMPPTVGSQTGTPVSSSPCQRYGEPHGACGQLFRRDEFLWHSRNVHADLDLLERACPLSAYGCPVTQRQLSTPHGAHLVYDARLGAFGLLPAPPAVTPDPQGLDRLSSLPLELQRHLLGYLDGFSLNQLALASCRMREVCASLLRARGMVLLRWERCCHDNDDGGSSSSSGGGDGGCGIRRWKVQDKVWRFSTAYSCVESWYLVDAPSLSNHLQCCPWNQVEHPLEARALPCMNGTPELERLKPVGACLPMGRGTHTLFHSLAPMESPYWGCR
ncbi:uncharacterized protein LOC105897706 [Clupea harengus]|uniref:Uncharacterized protein LOC105897706 n=1 Tax=Clupea harengus TaxID=7950 RepID=A0A6P8GSX5_CLUHA|nr:uncharacterized protein LOC105897706 [Clupea harengus]XP_031437874.1 uncharacterized protein LOC105897706 [Clupea harengus]XP_031437875.1 uncharacterized protein LOC105897706 [Clupea harengus]